MKITMISNEDVATLKAAKAILKNLKKKNNKLNKAYCKNMDLYETYERFLDELGSLSIEVCDWGDIILSA